MPSLIHVYRDLKIKNNSTTKSNEIWLSIHAFSLALTLPTSLEGNKIPYNSYTTLCIYRGEGERKKRKNKMCTVQWQLYDLAAGTRTQKRDSTRKVPSRRRVLCETNKSAQMKSLFSFGGSSFYTNNNNTETSLFISNCLSLILIGRLLTRERTRERYGDTRDDKNGAYGRDEGLESDKEWITINHESKLKEGNKISWTSEAHCHANGSDAVRLLIHRNKSCRSADLGSSLQGRYVGWRIRQSSWFLRLLYQRRWFSFSNRYCCDGWYLVKTTRSCRVCFYFCLSLAYDYEHFFLYFANNWWSRTTNSRHLTRAYSLDLSLKREKTAGKMRRGHLLKTSRQELKRVLFYQWFFFLLLLLFCIIYERAVADERKKQNKRESQRPKEEENLWEWTFFSWGGGGTWTYVSSYIFVVVFSPSFIAREPTLFKNCETFKILCRWSFTNRSRISDRGNYIHLHLFFLSFLCRGSSFHGNCRRTGWPTNYKTVWSDIDELHEESEN